MLIPIFLSSFFWPSISSFLYRCPYYSSNRSIKLYLLNILALPDDDGPLEEVFGMPILAISMFIF